MDSPTNTKTVYEHIEKVNQEAKPNSVSISLPPHGNKTTKGGIVLVPQPSDEPHDPLNWSLSYKILVLAILCLSAYTGLLLAVVNASGLVKQAVLYKKTPIQISYSLSAGTAGIAVGPLLWLPLSHRFGRVACIFWGMIFAMVCTIWSAVMTHKNDYDSFVVSRLFACIFASVGQAIGASNIMDIFFLHQRGRAFAAYGIVALAGTTMGPTLSGFIVEHTSWTVQFWYALALEGLTALLTLLFMKETGYTRPGSVIYPKPPSSYVKNRLATLFGTRSVIPFISWKQVASYGFSQIQLGMMPVTIIVGIFQFITFGWIVAIQSLLAVFLQEPVVAGGYGFSAEKNALFSFAGWVSVISAMAYGALVGDRLPLYLCNRWGGGVWKPEYRLYSLWGSTFILVPVGLGIFAAALEYHLHYMVLALGSYLAAFGTIASAPPTINYLVECFTTHAVEVASILNFYRLILGVVIPFFISDWIKSVGGTGWVFGMMAFLSLVPYAMMCILMWKGPTIRAWHAGKLISTEEGTKLATVDVESK